MNRLVTLLVIICLAGFTLADVTISGSVQSGAYNQNICISMDKSNDPSWPLWGPNASSDYTYDGSQSSIITNSQTAVSDKLRLDQSSSNNYAKQLSMGTNGMGIAEDTVGMMNIQPNEPESQCDRDGFLAGGEGSGSYPVSESLEGKTGAVFHNGGVYSSEVGLDDATVHLKGDTYATNHAIAYTDMIITSKKGFDKSSDNQNTETFVHTHEKAATADLINGTEQDLEYNRTIDYTSAVNNFNEVLETVIQTKTEGISEERLEEFINETVNQTAE